MIQFTLNIILLILAFLNFIIIIRQERNYKKNINAMIRELNSNVINGNVEDSKYTNGFNWGLIKAVDIVSKYKL